MIAATLRVLVLALLIAALTLALGSNSLAGFQLQRAQRAVFILVNVTPAPLADILRTGRGSARLADAQATPQQAVKVEAEVSPNPTATLLYTNNSAYTIDQTAGTTKTYPCAYTVTVDTTVTNWTLRHGLSNDFAPSFAGGDLENDSYAAPGTPGASPVPFVVYPDNKNTWVVLATSGGKKSYCVDLTLAIPASVAGGAYSTNAVYTLYY